MSEATLDPPKEEQNRAYILDLLKRLDARLSESQELASNLKRNKFKSEIEWESSTSDEEESGEIPESEDSSDLSSIALTPRPKSKASKDSEVQAGTIHSTELHYLYSSMALQAVEEAQEEERSGGGGGYLYVGLLGSVAIQWVLLPLRWAFPLEWWHWWLIHLLDLGAFGTYLFHWIFPFLFPSTRRENERMVRKLVDQSEIKRQFDKFDKDGDGHITVAELMETMEYIGEHPSESEVVKLIDEIDVDQNGTIEFEEFCNFVENFRVGRGGSGKGFGRLFAKHYYALTASSVGLYCDLLASLPLHWLPWEWCRYFLLLQLLKLPTVYTVSDTLRSRSFNPTLFRLTSLVGLTFLVAHWVGCGWVILGASQGFGSSPWVPPASFPSLSLSGQYVRALHWGFVHSSTGQLVEPVTPGETFFSLVVLFLGLSLYASVIGNVGSLLSNWDSTAATFQERMASVQRYMHYHRLPAHLQERVTNYYEYLWARQKGIDEGTLFGDLPASMRTDIALCLNREVLEKVPFFANASEALLSVLVRLLRPQVFAPGEYLIRYGDIGREMFFINKGVVVVTAQDPQHILSVLSDGSFFGEYALLFSQKRTANVRSSTYCDLFVLTREDFQQVLRDFPEFADTMVKEGIKRVVEKMDFFQPFSAEFRQELVSLLRPQTYPAGEYLVRKDDPGREMFILSKGTVEVVSKDGKTIYKVLQEGEVFGELALITDQRRSASVRAVTHCDVFLLRLADFQKVLKNFPQFARAITQMRQKYLESNSNTRIQ